MKEYNFDAIEKKWQKHWEKLENNRAIDFDNRKKHYHLVEFPYPSGEGLHVGHVMGYGASDAYVRMMRMRGFNVLFPIGWDAFGLPTENFAIKNKIKPQEATAKNIVNYRQQMKSLALSFDWSREINTTNPSYYKWTQWIFLQFYKHSIVDSELIKVDDNDKTTPRLAYQAEMPVNWCPSCKINLANEEVINGKCERCGTETTRQMQKQWMLRITSYADRLVNDLKDVDYEERIKTQQINWIGRSSGTNIKFKIENSDEIIQVFTTRADTLFGCTYIVLSPEHELLKKLSSEIKNKDEVNEYINVSKKKSDLERTEINKDKSGIELKGVTAINPINNEKIPVWVADYVLANYGTGAVMAVPAHDERDFEFAKKYNLPIKEVTEPLFEKVEGVDKVRYNIPFKERWPIVAVIKHWSEDKFLCLKWKNTDWRGFVIGGIEDGETEIEAGIREIIEETGYLHPKFIRKLGGHINARFFQVNKGENRWAHFQPIYFELSDGEKKEISTQEKKIHEILWVNEDEVRKFLDWVADMQLIWHRAQTGDYYFGGSESNKVSLTEILTESNEFNGLKSSEAIKKITEKLKQFNAGDFALNYKLRDWVFSRQHYWGEPIPIIHCAKCGIVPLDESDLPLELPEVDNYEPTNTGESPLAKISDWVNVKCPKCGGDAKRETDTMPNWAGSSWYYLRYCDPTDDRELGKKDLYKYWLPVDIYNGGMEHTTLHLLYSRFWHKFLFDLGVVPIKEPYQKRIAHGIILGPDNLKMSKSRPESVINPEEMIERFGADTLRAYIMFIGPYNQASAWNMNGISGVHRFLLRVWKNQLKVTDKTDSHDVLIKLNQTISQVTHDLENFSLNTSIAHLMEFNNLLETQESISRASFQKFICLLFPFTPFIASELWEIMKFEGNLESQGWPEVEDRYLMEEEVILPIQINGKTRHTIKVNHTDDQEVIEQVAKENPKIKEYLANRKIIKIIYISGKILNFVVE